MLELFEAKATPNLLAALSVARQCAHLLQMAII